MAYILDGMTIAMEGTPLALTEDDDFAIQVFALVTIGIVVCPLADEAIQPNAGGEAIDQGVLRENDKRFLMVAYAFMRLREWH